MSKPQNHSQALQQSQNRPIGLFVEWITLFVVIFRVIKVYLFALLGVAMRPRSFGGMLI